ncbi:hypothetical protein [Flavobacterium sp.]|uniref:hypothetical protein n=1 Tax=Flavobacterium sp. TaxID=239 RepID=UPI0038FC6036
MKREYFGMLFIIGSVALIFLAEYFFGEAKVMDNLSRFIVIWIMIAFQVGQYSMRFPKWR